MPRKIGKTKKPLFSRVSSSASSTALSNSSPTASSDSSSDSSSTASSNISSESTTLRDEIEMRTIKIIDVGYVAILYFVFGIVISVFFDKILDYEAIICPIGNGVDTHRLWEVLYSNRTPTTIRVGNFKIYELYEKLPIIILDNENDLYNEKLLDNKLNEIKHKQFDKNIINFEFWVSQILNTTIK